MTGRCARLPAEEGKEDKLIVIGDKGRAQLTRTHAKEIEEIIQDVGKVRITFAQACGLCSPALHVYAWDASERGFSSMVTLSRHQSTASIM